MTPEQKENLIEEAFTMIRNSPELGIGSCSNVDECLSDSDLRDEIGFSIDEAGMTTAQEIFDDMLETENIQQAYAEDIRNA